MSESTFFEGWKTFYDGFGWIYKVKIANGLIDIHLFPDENNIYHPNKKTPTKTVRGYIQYGKIITTESFYKYENGCFYELNNEETWNEYREK